MLKKVLFLKFNNRHKPLLMIFTFFAVLWFTPSDSSAIPAVAGKHDLSCTSCHTKTPQLNAFGEAFHRAGF